MEKRKSVRLLVVEGESGYREHLRECIELCSHQYELDCRFASNGGEARQLLSSFTPSVVLIDLHLVEGDSVEFMRGCSQIEVPIVVASEARNHEVEERALANGACAMVSRSDDPEDLESVLHLLATVSTEVCARH